MTAHRSTAAKRATGAATEDLASTSLVHCRKALLTTAEAARLITYAESTMRHWAIDPDHAPIKPLRIGARGIRWKLEDLRQLAGLPPLEAVDFQPAVRGRAGDGVDDDARANPRRRGPRDAEDVMHGLADAFLRLGRDLARLADDLPR